MQQAASESVHAQKSGAQASDRLKGEGTERRVAYQLELIHQPSQHAESVFLSGLKLLLFKQHQVHRSPALTQSRGNLRRAREPRLGRRESVRAGNYENSGSIPDRIRESEKAVRCA